MAEINTQYRDKLDISEILLRHKDRINMASANPDTYNPYLETALIELPMNWREWVTDRDDEYTKEEYEFVYEYDGGIRLGSEYDPLLYDELNPVKRLPDGSIDWEDPNIMGPKRKLVKNIDYRKLHLFINMAEEKAGLTYKTEALNSEYGLYPDEKDLDLGTPTPLDDPKKNEQQEQSFLRKPKWINYKGTPKLVTNFRGFAVGVGDNEKPWFFNEVAIRQTKQKPLVILVTATQGEGKTYTAKRLAEILDKKFDPDKQIVMSRGNILKLVSGRGGLKRNQCIIMDESQWGASSREWGDKEQIKLMKFLAAARFKGYVIFIVSLHRSMLDNIIRDRIINFHIHMEERGKATIYEPRHARFDEPSYPTRRGGLLLQLPDYDACDYVSCLDCEFEETCQTKRAVYERNKTTFIEGEAEKDAKLEMQEAAAEMDEKELATLLIDDTDDIRINRNGFYDADDIKYKLMEKFDADISGKKAARVRIHLMKLKPPTISQP